MEETKDELYRLLSDCVNGGYPLRNNAQRGRYRKAVGTAIRSLEAWDAVKAEIDTYLIENEFGTAYRQEVAAIIDKHLQEVEE